MKYLIFIILILLTACGKDGAQGVQGEAGPRGQSGTNGTNVTMIKFCPQFPDTYGSSYPEYGMCVDNNLYAVYFNNAGKISWLTLLTSGNYTTTTSFGNCNFKVKPNCIVETL